MNQSSPFIISIMGWSGSGKTTFIETCIRILSERGYRVFALKSTHLAIHPDTPGTDSHRFGEAGALGVCLLSGSGSAVFLKERNPDPKRLHDFFPHADIILAEGYHGESVLRFEAVSDPHSTQDMKFPLESLDGVLTDSQSLAETVRERGTAVFSLKEPEDFLRFVLERKGDTEA